MDGRTNGRTNRWTDGRTKPLIELRVHNYEYANPGQVFDGNENEITLE